ncbi:hypothetical protein N7489_010018 [Penicillium chrysogenum]|jgi:hypothetical protein|uniref:Uncharacterized protein n=1 Tax=Penicillium chrysogenum TaxID=5076 RepID=A0ABQ8WUU5_PENCH|nr:uncharacterized protein N7489_010018 [Penicillium chrysogenum]KAJ5229310.1 hypothetical protein N7489_010018 [Penicillium chrysogenum]KAJ5258714.1 hypothetical protein N7524_010270 [Penicillium chrysogenum]KAJ5282810.1 hypothetical protein N7505_000790 [Penicillium chrysogenum]KAJ6169184.1 hypothetical protein N7497_002027 [Penicillium chrysogenum]
MPLRSDFRGVHFRTETATGWCCLLATLLGSVDGKNCYSIPNAAEGLLVAQETRKSTLESIEVEI